MKQRFSLKSNAVKFRLLTLTLLTFVLGGKNAWAQAWVPDFSVDRDYYLVTDPDNNNQFYVYFDGVTDETVGPYTHISGPYNSSTNYSSEINCTDRKTRIVFCTTAPVLLKDQIFRLKNTSSLQLTFELGQNVNFTELELDLGDVTPVTVDGLVYNEETSYSYASEITMKIGNINITSGGSGIPNISNTGVFFIPSSNNLTTDKCEIAFKGFAPATTGDTLPDSYLPSKKRQFVIDGGATVGVSGSHPAYQAALSGNSVKVPLFRLAGGTINLQNVTIQNYWSNVSNKTIVHLNDGTSNQIEASLKVEHCLLKNCAATYAGIYLQHTNKNANSKSSTLITNSRIENCVSAHQNGANVGDNPGVRSHSQSISSLTLEKCVLKDNYGGGVRWQSVGASAAVFKDCTIVGNWSPGNGGGVLAKASASFNGCVIKDNRAVNDGGGIYLTTFEEFHGGSDYDNLHPRDINLVLDADTRIEDNIAGQNGGGIALFAKLICPRSGLPFYYNFDGASATTNQLKVGLSLEGALVQGNRATLDGGGVYISREALATCYGSFAFLKYGTIIGNTANRNGGGVAIVSATQQQVNTTTDPNKGPAIPTNGSIFPQDIAVEVGGGLAGDDTQHMVIEQNEAQNGGGIYVEGYPITYHGHTSQVYTSLFAHAYIQNGNSADNNGGGVYMKTGTLTMNDCTIDENTADNDGGGIYVDEGTITTAIRTAQEVSEAPATSTILPEPYIDVEYIAIAGNATSNYIDTRIPVNTDNTIWVHGERGTSESYVLHAYYNGNNRVGVKFLSSGIQYYWKRNNVGLSVTSNQSYESLGLSRTSQEITYAMNNGGMFIKDGLGNKWDTTYSGTHPTGGDWSTTWQIFKGQNNTSTPAKFYEAKIYSSGSIDAETGDVTGTLRAHLVPCYNKNSGAVGVFDMVKYGDGNNGYTADDCFISGTGTITYKEKDSSSGGGGTQPVSGCTITNNIASNDGGGIYLNTGHIFLTNSKINENQAIDSCGGGVYNHQGNIYVNYWDGSDPTQGTNLTVRGETTPSEFKDNTAGRNGGGLNTHRGRIFMRGQTTSKEIEISGNTAGYDPEKGAGNGAGGGVFCMGDSSDATAEQIRLFNVNMIGNKALGTGTTITTTTIVTPDPEDPENSITETETDTVTNGAGGGIYLQHGAINITKVKLQGNYAQQNGGGVNNHNGVINVKGCTIGGETYYNSGLALEGNKADSCGGGIYTQHGDINITNHKDAALGDHITKFSYNIAEDNGGGINTHSGKVVATGEYTDDFSKDIFIDYNKAINGSGGGIFCMGDGTGTLADPDLLLTYVSLVGNKAESGAGAEENGVITGCGGAMYLHEGAIFVQDADMEGNYAHHNGGAINNHRGDIRVLGSMIGGDTYYNNGARGEGNKARNSGGGVYTNFGNVDIQDYTEHLQGNVRFLESKVTYNEAGQNGGGINTHKGTITVNYDITTGKERESDHEIEITYNKANKGGGIYADAGTIITANAKIENNWATENGGGVNNHSGDISFYGGTLSNNTAETGKGGGAFTFVGDVNIMPFPVDWTGSSTQPTLNDGMMIYNNIAKLNGGGINNHTGRIDMRHARMKNNTSTLGNGGGIFCEGPHSNATGFTIRMLCSEVVQNKTRGQNGTEAEPTGRGGGVYLKYGSIYAHASDFLLNSANINGGGVDNHQGTLLLYGCTLDGNTAVTGRGGGIYSHSGDITTGPCTDRDNNTMSKATRVQYNTAKINGGGINNHQGNIFLNGDHILNNTAEEGHGGGIYISDGVIDMYGGKIANNEAKLGDGGGVWSGGGQFNIQKRQGKPIVEIVDVEVTGANTATVHYHLIDKGKGDIVYPATTGAKGQHGIFWSISEIGVDTATYDDYNNDYVSMINTGHVSGEDGCYRLNITIPNSLEPAGKTFYTKAYAVNDASPALSNSCATMSFTTFSSKPTVLTGGVSNITSNSAEANGKVLYAGTGENDTIRAEGIQVWKKSETPAESHLKPYTGIETFFTVVMTDLEPNTEYCMRAYATNVSNPSYAASYSFGEIEEFKTLKNTPNMAPGPLVVTYMVPNGDKFDVSFKYTMNTNGLSAYGFVISTDSDPELHSDEAHTIAGENGESYFTGTKEGLDGNTTYYVRAYATAANPVTQDLSDYSLTTPIQFTTPNTNGDPVVRATTISNITRSGATISGEIVHKGSGTITKYGVCWSHSNHHPDHEHCTDLDWNNPAPASLDSDSTFSVVLPDTLKPNTTYYIRIYATNGRTEEGSSEPVYVYSNDFNFTTLPINLPKMELNVTDIANNTATVVCVVDTCGAPLVTTNGSYGIMWKMDGASDYTTVSASNYNASTGMFTVELSGLTSDTKYWVKAFCSNATGTANDGSGPSESREVSFNTLYNMPIVDAVTIDAILYDATGTTSHTIRVYGSATPGETGQTIKKFGYIYSTQNNPTIYTLSEEYDEEAIEVGPGSMGSGNKTNLTNKVMDNRYYYVRAYASVKSSPTSDNDYSYGPTTRVLTLAQVKRIGATSTHQSAQLSARIHSYDEEHHLRKYGICWAEQPYTPTATGSHVERDITATPMDFTLNTMDAGEALPAGEYYWRGYVKNEDNDSDPAKGISYTSSGSFTIYQIAVTAEAVPAAAATFTGTGYFNTPNPPINLSAIQTSSNYQFEKWENGATGEFVSTDNPYKITADSLTGSTHFKAYFKSKVSIAAGANGKVRFDHQEYAYGPGANIMCPYDTTCTVQALGNTGYVFVNWTDAAGEMISDEAEYTFQVKDITSLTANFEEASGGKSATSNVQQPRPRDIYPAPAREPWDWDNDDFCVAQSVQTDTITDGEDEELRAVRERISRTGAEPEDIPQIIVNKATAGRGGGIYMTNANPGKPTELVFTGGDTDATKGKILYNFAGQAGGGVYIARKAYMQMKGHCEVNANWVPKGKDGGGIYLSGRLYVGENWDDPLTAHALQVSRNFAMDGDSAAVSALYKKDELSLEDKRLRNNILLERNEYVWGPDDPTGQIPLDDTANVITLLSNISGKHLTDESQNVEAPTNMGFRVQHGFCPVVATAGEFPDAVTPGSGHYLNEGESANDTTFAKVYEKWLTKLMPQGDEMGLSDRSAIFEDSETYIAIHSNTDNQPFRAKYIYLWGSWTHPAVRSDPEYIRPMYGGNGPGDPKWLGHYIITNSENSDDTSSNDTLTIPSNDSKADTLIWEIYSEEGLAWFSNYVNGLNSFATGDVYPGSTTDTIHRKYNKKVNPYAKAKLMNDLDMTAHFWVPIGSVTKYNENGVTTGGDIYTDEATNPHPFKGEFDGQGHIIRGIDCRFLTGIEKFGLFGDLSDNAVVKNVFVDDALFATDKNNETFEYMIGGISGVMSENAILSGAEARATIDLSICYPANTYAGGLVGKTRGTKEKPAVIHSSMAMPEIKGNADYVGGLVGQLGTGQLGTKDTLVNSFSNPKFLNNPADGKYFGGLVGENKGLVENCYARLQGTEPLGFGWLAGTNSGSIKYSYIPAGKSPYVGGTGTGTVEGHGTYGPTELVSGKYGFMHRDHNIEATNDYVKNDTLIGGLQRALNAWVIDKKTAKRPYESWSRTMASPINDDLPVLMLSDFNCLGSIDKIFLVYDEDVNTLYYDRDFDTVSFLYHPNTTMYLYNANSDTVRITGNALVPLHIHEDVGIVQEKENTLFARVGVTFDNSSGDDSWELGGAAYDWHMFSSALNSVPMGLTYRSDKQQQNGKDYVIKANYDSGDNLKTKGITEDNYNKRAYMDPPYTEWNTVSVGYFPTNTPYGTWGAGHHPAFGEEFGEESFDFYCFNEESRHWINFKREGVDGFFDHWHQDAVPSGENGAWMHHNIAYKNETTMRRGKGYMMGVSKASMLMADGILNNGQFDSDESLTNSPYSFNPSGYSEEIRGTNLVGNPYQSYLDFDKLADANSGIYGKSYYVFDADSARYLTYTAHASENPDISAPGYIHPHQGFFVKTAENISLTFKNNMRTTGKALSTYRSKDLNYPLVNLLCYDSEGKRDVTTVEINRPDEGGGLKMKGLRKGKMLIYARWDNTDYQTAFTPVGIREVPVRFQAFEDGVFTMRWGTLHGNFHYLHLIDNMTGADVDMLRSKEYLFEASSADYLSRFKLVFEATGLEEESDNEDDNGSTVNFAFRMGDEIIVNGEGYLEVFDLQGRCLTAKRLAGAQSSVSLPNAAAGVYFLRLSNDKQVKTQKMVISY